jgi:hypothetical protein
MNASLGERLGSTSVGPRSIRLLVSLWLKGGQSALARRRGAIADWLERLSHGVEDVHRAILKPDQILVSLSEALVTGLADWHARGKDYDEPY